MQSTADGVSSQKKQTASLSLWTIWSVMIRFVN